MVRAGDLISSISYGFDAAHLYLRYDLRQPFTELAATAPFTVAAYLAGPGAQAKRDFSRCGRTEPRTLLGLGANYELSVSLHPDEVGLSLVTVGADGKWSAPLELPKGAAVGVSGSVVEVALPFAALGEVDSGTALLLRSVVSQKKNDLQLVPANGPAKLVAPDLGLTTTILEVDDPGGDDFEPGAYTYPTDGVFGGGAYDLVVQRGL